MISDEQADKFVKALHEKTQRDQEPKTIILKRSDRGFEYGKFTDLSGAACQISKSSLATDDAIWLGMRARNVNDGREAILALMQLNKQMVQSLLPHLERFAKTGELSNVNKGFFCSNCCEFFVVSLEHPVKFCAICGDEFDAVLPNEEEEPLTEQVSCPDCKGEFAIHEAVEYRLRIGALWCPYCGYDLCEAKP